MNHEKLKEKVETFIEDKLCVIGKVEAVWISKNVAVAKRSNYEEKIAR